MAQQFGNTWWGSEWLRSLSHIDYENRIPRGAAYARKGNVKEIKLKDNVITAKVEGSRPTPYKVSIIIPPFFPEQVEALIQALMERPGLISRLLNRELAPEVLDIARKCGLKIFPERWSDLKMQCNCPDWAVPCKHLAAVVYMFSREIDNNPFIVFRMHNVDLLQELKKRGIDIEDMRQDVTVAELKDVVQVKSAKEVFPDLPAFRRIDFSRLTDRSEALLMLLPDNPPFCPDGNFKEDYAMMLRRVKKNVQRFFARKLDATGLFPEVTGCISGFCLMRCSVSIQIFYPIIIPRLLRCIKVCSARFIYWLRELWHLNYFACRIRITLSAGYRLISTSRCTI